MSEFLLLYASFKYVATYKWWIFR